LSGTRPGRAGDQKQAARLSGELRALYDLARAVARAPYHVAELLERICSEVRESFGFERAMLVRYDPERRAVHAFVQQNIVWPGEDWLWIDRFPFLERALAEGQAVLVRDPSSEHAMPAKVAERYSVSSVVAVPLSIEDECLGFLVLDRGGEAFDLTPAELELLSMLGWMAAVFIDKADRYAELEETLESLRDVDHVKSDFISIASHELRTPIAVVHGIAATLHLRGNELAQNQLDELRSTLYEQSSRVVALVDELLDLSRLDAGAVPVRPERFRPRERIEVLLPTIAPDRLEEIDVTVPPGLEVVTDADGFTRIVSNLVTNALKYGSPPVEVDAERHNGTFRLTVQDCGAGVDPEFVPMLFERFSRADSTRRRQVVGAGLGLAIARSFAQTLGGDLVYEPARPHGARFALLLPAEPVGEQSK
jgi:signal transduction histidine kinase